MAFREAHHSDGACFGNSQFHAVRYINGSNHKAGYGADEGFGMIGLGEILAGLNILDKLGKFWNSLRGDKHPAVESVAARFIRLFESHDVHRNQIPRFFGHGLSIKDVHDDASLLAKLDESMLDAACALFAVRREWMDGAEKQVYPYHDFYKCPERVGGFLETLVANSPSGEIDGVLVAPDTQEGAALLILEETLGTVGDKPIYRHHLCNNWVFDYWKSRAYLTACVAIAWKHRVHIRGVTMPKLEVERLAAGEVLLCSGDDSAWRYGLRKWYPEDMALRPEAFLDGVDPELNQFGITAGLELWLKLQAKGYMETGLEMYEHEAVRHLFQKELAEYLPAVANTEI